MTFTYTVNADHYQFYVEDADARADTSTLWGSEAMANRLDVLPGLIAVGTSRYGGPIPVEVEVATQRPPDTALDAWDHVVECSLMVASGRILLTSPASFGPEAPTIVVTPDIYRALVYFGALDSVSTDDDMVGDDHYRVVVWPDVSVPPQVLKRKPLP